MRGLVYRINPADGLRTLCLSAAQIDHVYWLSCFSMVRNCIGENVRVSPMRVGRLQPVREQPWRPGFAHAAVSSQ